MNKFIAILISVLSLPFAAGAAYATQVPEMSMLELIEKTSYVFVGTVVNTRAEVSATLPASIVTFRIEREFMGSVATGEDSRGQRQVTFAVPGGQLPDGTLLEIEAAPKFVFGETYLIFVRKGEWFLTPSTNWFYSVFRVVKTGNEKYFVNESGSCVADLTEDHPFYLGPPLISEFIHPVDPRNPNLGTEGWRSSEKITPEDAVNRAQQCIPVDSILDALQSILPARNHTPDIRFESSIDSIVHGHPVESKNLDEHSDYTSAKPGPGDSIVQESPSSGGE